MGKRILVTGGLGYIGSHICLELINSNHTPIIIDNLENSSMSTYEHLQSLTDEPIQYHRLDLRNQSALYNALKVSEYDAIIHTAGYKDARKSLKLPQHYFYNNIASTLNVIHENRQSLLKEQSEKPIVYSSSASVYGNHNELFVKENAPLRPLTPYAYSKLVSEEMFFGMKNVILLRYFNVIGNDDYLHFGERKSPTVKNVLQHLFDSAWNVGTFTINGKNHNSVDGTPIRDFVDVRDLAKAHVIAVEDAMRINLGVRTYNIGSGDATTILELAQAFDEVEYDFGDEIKGDISRSVADISLIDADLGWKPNITLKESIDSAWRRYQHVNK